MFFLTSIERHGSAACVSHARSEQRGLPLLGVHEPAFLVDLVALETKKYGELAAAGNLLALSFHDRDDLVGVADLAIGQEFEPGRQGRPDILERRTHRGLALEHVVLAWHDENRVVGVVGEQGVPVALCDCPSPLKLGHYF